MSPEDLENRFNYHAPNEQKVFWHQEIRHHCLKLATIINELVPDGREKSVAISRIEEAMYWSNAGIARNQ